MFLGAPFYLVSNGDDLRVFHFRSALENDEEVFRGTRINLRSQFDCLHSKISKPRISELRRAIRQDGGG